MCQQGSRKESVYNKLVENSQQRSILKRTQSDKSVKFFVKYMTHKHPSQGKETDRKPTVLFITSRHLSLHHGICSKIQISKLNNSFTDKPTKRCFGDKLTVLDVIFMTTDHPPLERCQSAEQTFMPMHC